jgi:biopolymer transport protein ExbD
MTFPKPSIRRARIEIVPMIDTIFFLLVFFMMSTLSMVKLQAIGLSIPRDAAKGSSKPPSHVVLSISPKGEYYLQGRRLEVTALPGEFRRRLAEHPGAIVVLNVAATQKTQTLVSTMDILNELMTQAGNKSPILITTPNTERNDNVRR